MRMALAEALHHSSGTSPSKRYTRVVEGARSDALRGQKTVTRAGEGEVREEHQALRGQTRLPPGMRPALLVEVQPQGRVGRHFAEHMAELAPLVQILDAPVPQLGEQLVDIFNIFRLIDTQTPVEQVIEVPEISLPSHCCRTVLSAPQMAEQLVEVPTVVSFSSLQQLSVEQIIDIPVPLLGGRSVAQNVDTPVLHGRGRVSGSGLQGFRPGQGSTTFPPPERISERLWSKNVDIPGGGLQGFSPGQGSTAVCGAEHANIPVPLGRGGLGDGGLHGLSQGQGSTAVSGAEHVDIPVPHGRGGLGGGGLHAVQGFLPGSSSTADIPPGGGMGDSRSRQATCRFSPRTEFISVCGAECR